MKIDSNIRHLSQFINLLVLTLIFLLGTTSCIDNNINNKKYNSSPVQTKQIFTQSNNSQLLSIATLSPSVRSLSPNYVCSNVNSLRNKSWHDQKFWNSVNKLNPRMIRIPGGSVSNYWNWQKGGLIEDISSLPDGLPRFMTNKDRQYTASKLKDFYAGFETNALTPLFVLNMLTSDLKSQLKMLQTARDLGMPVKYVELGNEFYFGTKNYRKMFPRPQDYAKTANQWVSAIKQEFPEAEIAVIGVGSRGKNSLGRRYKWNEEIIATTLPLADAITIHKYPSNGLANRKISTEKYPYFLKEDIPFILGEPFESWYKTSNTIRDFPENKKIWVTEYNLIEKTDTTQEEKRQRIAGSWIHGMYTLSMSLLFLEDPRIEIACNHMLIGSSQFSTILASEKSFKNPSDKNTVSQPLALSATGSSLKLLGDATEGMTNAQKIDFAQNLTLTGNDEFSYPALYGWMFTNKAQKNSLIVNLSERQIELEVSSLFKSKINYETISGSPRDLVTRPGILQQKIGNTKTKIILPPYSVTKMSNNKK